MNRRRLWASLLGCLGVTFALLAINLGLGNTPALGLDLQGGVSVVLAPDCGRDRRRPARHPRPDPRRAREPRHRRARRPRRGLQHRRRPAGREGPARRPRCRRRRRHRDAAPRVPVLRSARRGQRLVGARLVRARLDVARPDGDADGRRVRRPPPRRPATDRARRLRRPGAAPRPRRPYARPQTVPPTAPPHRPAHRPRRCPAPRCRRPGRPCRRRRPRRRCCARSTAASASSVPPAAPATRSSAATAPRSS